MILLWTLGVCWGGSLSDGAPDGDGLCAQVGWEEGDFDIGALTWVVDGRFFYTVWDASRVWSHSGGITWETSEAERWRSTLQGCGYSIPWPAASRLLPVVEHGPDCAAWAPHEHATTETVVPVRGH